MPIKSIEWDGKKITKPGIYSKIPLEIYHSQQLFDGPSVSSSGLRKLFYESPAHFYDAWSGNPDRAEPEDKAHFVLGRAVHHLVLGEPFFAKLFCSQPPQYADAKTGELKTWNYTAKVCKEWREMRLKEGRIPLTPTQIEQIKGMAISLSKHPLVKAGILRGSIERSIFFRDKDTGIWVKVRPDAIPGDSEDFADLKTIGRPVVWENCVREIGDRGYHMQGALIRQAAREVLGIKRPTFTDVLVESKRPHCVRVVSIKDGSLDLGEKQNRWALDLMARCLKDKKWPGPGGEQEDAGHIELSERASTLIEDRLKYSLS